MLQYRGMLIHVTHIDPDWVQRKDTEEPFDLAVALDLLPIMASHGMNTLIVDVEDGVQYKSHRRHIRHRNDNSHGHDHSSHRLTQISADEQPQLRQGEGSDPATLAGGRVPCRRRCGRKSERRGKGPAPTATTTTAEGGECHNDNNPG